jgi:hypothetical protein
MIKFFRKIRQGLISENKFSKYLLYAIGEIVLVVIGIFIALQLNLWSENNKLDDVRQGYYHQLLEDLDKDKVYIEETIASLDSYRFEYNNYLESYIESNLAPEQALANLLKSEIKSLIISFNTSTIETLENTGDLKLLASEIRNKLVDLKRSQDFTGKVAFENDSYKHDILKEAIILIGSTSLSERLKNQEKLSKFLEPEFNNPKFFLTMEAMHAWKSASEELTLMGLKDLLKDIIELQELITKELKE